MVIGTYVICILIIVHLKIINNYRLPKFLAFRLLMIDLTGLVRLKYEYNLHYHSEYEGAIWHPALETRSTQATNVSPSGVG